MNIIICLDDDNGMMFNKRRQSQDRILRADLKEFIKDKDLYMNNYSYKLYKDIDNGNIKVGNTYFKDNTTLFAHWTKNSSPDVGKVSLTYTPGDGSGDAYTRYCDKGSTRTVESNSFWKTGYHFTYWKDTNNDSSNCSDKS